MKAKEFLKPFTFISLEFFFGAPVKTYMTTKKIIFVKDSAADYY